MASMLSCIISYFWLQTNQFRITCMFKKEKKKTKRWLFPKVIQHTVYYKVLKCNIIKHLYKCIVVHVYNHKGGWRLNTRLLWKTWSQTASSEGNVTLWGKRHLLTTSENELTDAHDWLLFMWLTGEREDAIPSTQTRRPILLSRLPAIYRSGIIGIQTHDLWTIEWTLSIAPREENVAPFEVSTCNVALFVMPKLCTYSIWQTRKLNPDL